MKINSVNNLFYSQNLGFTGGVSRKTSMPFSVENPKTDNRDSYELEKEYVNNILKALNDRKEELYSFLDTEQDDNGLTLPDKLLNMFDTSNMKVTEQTFLHKTSGENVESLQKNGFDSTKINKTNFGPGFYVGTSEGSLLIYPGAKMQVEYKGNTARGTDLEKFDNIKGRAVDKLMEYLNLKPDFSNYLVWKEFEAFRMFVNEYSRETIAKKLGIDGAEAVGSDGYFVIFNPDAIKEIKCLDN